MAAAVTGNPFLDHLLEQTPPSASQPRRGQNYNYPPRLYLKPDGMVVLLQGDPQNRAYYQDKGYKLLSDTPGRDGPSEVRQYLDLEYPKILKEQHDKAELVNAIRRSAERHPEWNLEVTFDEYSIDEVRDYLRQIKDESGHEVRVIRPRRAQAREDAREAALLAGVETNETQSLEGLQATLERGRERTIQGTGYDPLEQARRRRPGGST